MKKIIMALLLCLLATTAQANSYSVDINIGHFFKGINAPQIPGVSKSNYTRGFELQSSNGSFIDVDHYHDGTGNLAWVYMIGHRYTLYDNHDIKLKLGYGIYGTNQSYFSFRYDRHYPTYGLFPSASIVLFNRLDFRAYYIPRALSYNLGGSLIYGEVSVRLFTF
jgi:hypothetical protein